MTETINYKRRGFIKTSLAAGTATGLSSVALTAGRKPAVNQDRIRIGVVGFGPHSCALVLLSAFNLP